MPDNGFSEQRSEPVEVPSGQQQPNRVDEDTSDLPRLEEDEADGDQYATVTDDGGNLTAEEAAMHYVEPPET
jgi:hypothetical protein